MTAILIAERDEAVRSVLVDVTRDHFPDASIHLARDVDELLAATHALTPPCAAVLHWGLAEGYLAECVGRLRANSARVLLISGWDLQRVLHEVYVDAVLHKPFELSDYLSSLRSMFETKPA